MKRRLRTSYTKLPVAAPPKGRGAAALSRRAWRRQLASSVAVYLSLVVHVVVGGLWLRDVTSPLRDGRVTTSGGRAEAVDLEVEFVRSTSAPTIDVDEPVRIDVWDTPPPPPEPSVEESPEPPADPDVAPVDVEPEQLEGRSASGAPQPRELDAMMTVRALRPPPPEPPPEAETDPDAIEWPAMPDALVEPRDAPTAPTPDAPAPSDDPGPEAEPSGGGDTDTVVETRPEPLPDNPAPDYPRIARRRGWQGVVILSVRVLETGVVDDAFVLVTSGRDVLDESALEAVLGWRFEPARYDGEPVAGRRDVAIRFELK